MTNDYDGLIEPCPVYGCGSLSCPRHMPLRAAWQAAESIAADMISAARGSGTDPIVFVTGNSYMPPLRSYAAAEAVWQSVYDEDAGAFDLLTEHLESLLSDASVALEGHPDDNCLYVIDLARWQYREDAEESETLAGEWEPILTQAELRIAYSQAVARARSFSLGSDAKAAAQREAESLYARISFPTDGGSSAEVIS